MRLLIILFIYYNLILYRGVENFLKKIYDVGVRGLVVLDLLLEEVDILLELVKDIGIELILLVVFISLKERIKVIVY